MEFPVYRKMKGFNRWYKIVSATEFYECGLIGSKTKTVHIIAHQYPEKLRIMDMLACEDPFEEIDSSINQLFEA